MSRTLGYKPTTAFMLSVFPQVYRQIRLPIFAVLAYSLSVVDMSLILGPGNPPTFAVQILNWFSDSDFSLRPLASAAAITQLVLILVAIGIWIGGERNWHPVRAGLGTIGGPYPFCSNVPKLGLGWIGPVPAAGQFFTYNASGVEFCAQVAVSR